MTVRHCFNDNPTVFEATGKSVVKALLGLVAKLTDDGIEHIGAINLSYMEESGDWNVVAYTYV